MPRTGLFTPDGGKVTLATCKRPYKVHRAKLAGPVRPAVDHDSRQPVAVTDDEVLTALRGQEMKVEGKLSHRHRGLERFDDADAIIAPSQPKITCCQRIGNGRIAAAHIQRDQTATHIELPHHVAVDHGQ